MHRLIYPLVLLWLTGALAGCASMSKKDCENADWHAIGYNDGARGIPAGHLNVYSQRCAEYKIAPDVNAYQTGWGEGIRNYCTSANGYNAGAAGYAYNNICPADVAPAYLEGYRQGLGQYCTPDNGLQQGLSGGFYRGVCPADMADAFMQRYRLGRDVRHARDEHQDIENRLDKVREALAGTQDPKAYHDLLEELSHLRYADERSEAMLAALNACTDDDWFQAGLSDGEDGQPYRAGAIADLCGSYGSGADPAGYRDGWQRGNAHYCSYDSGVYAGQAGLDYHDVCNGPGYLLFWGGYMQGLGIFRSGRYEDHPRPVYPHEQRQAPPPPPPAKHKRHKDGQGSDQSQQQPDAKQGEAAATQPAAKDAKTQHRVYRASERRRLMHESNQPQRRAHSED
ncbi:MAG TPA: DUF2799 domain-containing protein [Mariprofundaceae bacterium]|nr:DUF2799 domain-containing protein [Mariprofundaceae bacterium]